MMPQNPTSNDRFSLYPPEYREFADRLLAAMTHASRVEDDRRKHGQICKVLNCLSDSSPITVYGFWCAEAKQFAREWEELRVATLRTREEHAAYIQRLIAEDQARQAATSVPLDAPAPTPGPTDVLPPNPANDIAAPRYRTLKYVSGQNPFRPGTKNSRIWDLLLEGNRTRDQIAEASGADWKSVGYVIFLCRQSGFSVTHDKMSKTYRLVPPAPAA